MSEKMPTLYIVVDAVTLMLVARFANFGVHVATWYIRPVGTGSNFLKQGGSQRRGKLWVADGEWPLAVLYLQWHAELPPLCWAAC